MRMNMRKLQTSLGQVFSLCLASAFLIIFWWFRPRNPFFKREVNGGSILSQRRWSSDWNQSESAINDAITIFNFTDELSARKFSPPKMLEWFDLTNFKCCCVYFWKTRNYLFLCIPSISSWILKTWRYWSIYLVIQYYKLWESFNWRK